MKKYIDKLQAVGLVASDRSRWETVPTIRGGTHRTEDGIIPVLHNPFYMLKTDTGWNVSCIGRGQLGYEFTCATFDEAVTKLVETYQTEGLLPKFPKHSKAA